MKEKVDAQIIQIHSKYFLLLTLSLTYFLYKGIIYTLMGSFIPMMVILFVLMLFAYSFYKSGKAFRRTISFWAILIILWASTRILLTIINEFVKPIPEGHVNAQLGLPGLMLNLIFLFIGIYLIKYKKKIFG